MESSIEHFDKNTRGFSASRTYQTRMKTDKILLSKLHTVSPYFHACTLLFLCNFTFTFLNFSMVMLTTLREFTDRQQNVHGLCGLSDQVLNWASTRVGLTTSLINSPLSKPFPVETCLQTS